MSDKKFIANFRTQSALTNFIEAFNATTSHLKSIGVIEPELTKAQELVISTFIAKLLALFKDMKKESKIEVLEVVKKSLDGISDEQKREVIDLARKAANK